MTKSVGRVVTHMFYFVSQEELIASKVILLPCIKLIVRVSCLRFFEKFAKIELADNIAKRCQRYEMNKIKMLLIKFQSLYLNNIKN